MKEMIYLDNSAAARPSDEALSELMAGNSSNWGVPSQPHQAGQRLYGNMEEGLRSVYALLGAKEEDHLVITSGGAEAVNQAIFSAYYRVTLPSGKNHFLAASTDEAPVLMGIDRLEQMGCVSKLVPPDSSGRITPEAIADHITPRTAMLSLSWANGVTGVVNPVCDIGALCQERGILFHLDATHILGKLYFDLEDTGADMVSFNGDQLHAPRGVGGLLVKKGIHCAPLIPGGLDQGGKRGGALNVPALAALGVAAKQALEARDYMCTEIARLRHQLEVAILDGYPEAHLFFKEQERIPNSTLIGFYGIVNEMLLYALNKRGLCAGMGGGNFQQASLLLQASGIGDQLAHSAVQFSLSRGTTEAEVDEAAAIIVEEAKRLREISKDLL